MSTDIIPARCEAQWPSVAQGEAIAACGYGITAEKETYHLSAQYPNACPFPGLAHADDGLGTAFLYLP